MVKILFRFIIICLFSTQIVEAVTAEECLSKNETLTIGIISAVSGEVGTLLELMESPISQEKGSRIFHKGKLCGIDTVVVASKIGKVAAAAAATHLILNYQVNFIIFTGVAGAIDPTLNVGDIVIAHALIQHDVDARPFCPRYEIPLLKITSFHSDPFLEQLALQASQKFLNKEIYEIVPSSILSEFNIVHPKIMKGLVITGDQVISQETQKLQLKEQLPEALCVEMEGASIGHVCYEYSIPFVVIRIISDYADHQHSPVDVKKFVNQASGYYSIAVINNMYALIKTYNVTP